MILEFGNNQNKPGRCRYFEMRINLGITGPKANLWVNATTLIDALRATKFVDELSLETILYSLKVESRGKSIQLKDFTGQLQRDKKGFPYWNVIMQTQSVTTAPCIGRAISKKYLKQRILLILAGISNK
jgi:hypothetical protein